MRPRIIDSPPARPPVAELAALWRSCGPISSDEEVKAWMDECGICAQRVRDADLARVLPKDAVLPRWARYRSIPWSSGGYRVVVPLYGATGEKEALYARSLAPLRPSSLSTRSTPPAVGHRGLVMANRIGREMLRTGRLPDPPAWSTAVVVGGAADFLEWASSFPTWNAPVVLGMVPGTWTPELAARIPSETRVIVRVFRNPITERYAHRLQLLLGQRCEVIVKTT